MGISGAAAVDILTVETGSCGAESVDVSLSAGGGLSERRDVPVDGVSLGCLAPPACPLLLVGSPCPREEEASISCVGTGLRVEILGLESVGITAFVGGGDCDAPWSIEAGGVGAGAGVGVFDAESGADFGPFRRGTDFALGLKAAFDLSMLPTGICDPHDPPSTTLVDLVRGD